MPQKPFEALRRGVPAGALAGVLALNLLAWIYFGHFLSVWLFALAGATFFQPWLGLCLLAVVVSLDTARAVFGGIFVTYAELQFGVCLLAWSANATRRRIQVNWRPVWWGAPFSATVLLSALLHNEWYRVVPHWVRSSELILAIWLAANSFEDEHQRSRFRWVLAAATVVYAGAGLFEFLGAQQTRVVSFFTNPNQLGAYLNLLLPGLFVLVLAYRGLKSRWLWAALTALALTAALAAQSRGALLAGFFGFLAIWIGFFRSKFSVFFRHPLRTTVRFARSAGWPPAVGLAAVFLTVALSAQHPTVRQQILEAWRVFELRSKADLVAQRTPYYEIGWRIWKENVFWGVGPGNYERAIEARSDLVESYRGIPYYDLFRQIVRTHVHNLYLQILVNFGVFGLAAFLFLMFQLAREFIRSVPDSYWSLAGLGVMIAFLCHNMLDVTFPSLALETGLFLGAFLPLCEASRNASTGFSGGGIAGDNRPSTTEPIPDRGSTRK